MTVAALLGLTGLNAASAGVDPGPPVDEYGLTAQERAWIEVPEGADVEKTVSPEGDVQVTVTSKMAADDPRNQPVDEASVTTSADGTVTIVQPLAAGCTQTASINTPSITNRTLPVKATLAISVGCASSVYFDAEGWAPDSISDKKQISAGGVVSPGGSTTVSTSYSCAENFRYWTNYNRASIGSVLAQSARTWLRC
ncbi:hypothetical protein [Cellulomonas sp. Y8]|uniref:hypothetical protein n=1 Tax=Cellulomonas sp. Y8 TaxID=2591145 RepID=UPI0011C7A830|nr:hypothetical protein [Cellulomonas sp. Y8]